MRSQDKVKTISSWKYLMKAKLISDTMCNFSSSHIKPMLFLEDIFAHPFLQSTQYTDFSVSLLEFTLLSEKACLLIDHGYL